MESTIGENEKWVATVDDMINWLWHKGNYEGHVGWSAERNPDGIFGTSSHLGPRDMCMSMINIGGDDDELQLSSRMSTGINEGFREVVDRKAHEEHVKNMIKKHIKLIPEAVQVIDQRLLKTGVSAEEIASLSTGRATDAYKKLTRLDEATGKCVPSTRLQFRVMSDLLPGEWMAFDIYLPRSCQLEDFECAMLRHGLVMHLNLAALPSDDSLPANVVDSQGASLARSGSQALVKKRGCYQKVWAYKIAERRINDDDANLKNLEGWKALCDEADFGELMQALLGGESKQTKMAVVCHETTLEAKKTEKERPADLDVATKLKYCTWDGKLDDYTDRGDNVLIRRLSNPVSL
ncbi:hypothetical protein PAAG_00018 [Paracoccidioides lutzii Pb01]|uniref:Uncharacterized protein n=1 Tax=Paracoccidioides lutzii (strain ATCC MYA-826 / Pb01) TaxID=502779 RepID=C1GNC3_PARBA|nr:hypothetical protein PAAG_00018 [Paracoccidioides lutzii Pb01]EEH35695.2 hypothetical protein PAAG_00018 [Paracoccidioides lutzii Pb01]